MNIVVFGANGKVGRLVVQELLRRGHSVRAFVHGTTPDPQENLTWMQGDVHNQNDVEAAIEGCDAVVSTLGSWGTKDKDILSAGMRHIVPAMEAHGISRIVSLTGNVAVLPGEPISGGVRVVRFIFGAVAGAILRDADDHMRLLDESGLKYTVVRSTIMSDGEASGYRLVAKIPLFPLMVHRAAVTKSMADLLETNQWSRQAPFVA